MTPPSRKPRGHTKSDPPSNHASGRQHPHTVRRPRNLSLTREAIERGEAYSSARGTTLSALVEQFLRGLRAPVEVDNAALAPDERRRREMDEVRARTSSPLVRDLLGLLADSDLVDQDPRDLYRAHLWRKYGGK